ncbi:MAG: DUF3352 domain-containing protein [Limnospira sp.]
MMIEKTKPSPLVYLGTIALLVGGGVAAYFALTARKPIENVPLGANVVPRDAIAAVSLSTEPQQWERLRQYGTPESQAALQTRLTEWRDRLLTDNGYNYEQDIQPWVGDEVMVAWLPDSAMISGQMPQPSDSPPESPIVSARMVLLPIADAAKAKEILDRPKTIEGGSITERSYRGIEIVETEGLPQNYSVAVLGQEFILVTTAPSATDRAIDAYRGDDSLATTPGYAAAVQKIRNSAAFAQIYLNIPVAASAASLTSAQPIPAESLEQLKQNQGFATTAILEENGIDFRAVSWLKPNSQRKFQADTQARAMLKRIPETAIVTAGGSNLKRVWEDYNQGADANPVAPFNPKALAESLKESIGMELETDFLSWMDGEFSLALIPAIPNKEVPQKFAAGLAFMVEVSDRGAAETSLKQLDEVMRERNFQVGEATLNGQPVIQWTSPYGGFSVVRGWLDGDVAFATLGAPVANQFLPEPQNPITSNALFRETLPSDPDPNQGNFYINVEQVFDRKNLSLPPLPPQQQVWVNAIESIGLTTAVTGDRTVRYDVFVNFTDTMVGESGVGSRESGD